MRLVFRATTVSDLKWFRKYYSDIFADGDSKAKLHYIQTCQALIEYPLLGHLVGQDTPVRELSIPNTPFSFIYYVVSEEIIVIRVLDSRSER